MEPKLVHLPAFTVVGMKYRGKNEQNEIPQMWGRFIPPLRSMDQALIRRTPTR